MIHKVKIEDSDIVLVTKYSVWSGRTIIKVDGQELERANEKGKPYIYEISQDEIIKIYVKLNLPDLFPKLKINNKKYYIGRKLTWYDYILCLLPILLLFWAGIVGFMIFPFIYIINFYFAKSKLKPIHRYSGIVGFTAVSFSIILFIIMLLSGNL